VLGRGLADQTRVLGRQVQPERRREVPGRDRRWVRFQARTGSPARAIFLAIAKPIVPPAPSTAIASDISIRACYPLLRLLHADAEVNARHAGSSGIQEESEAKWALAVSTIPRRADQMSASLCPLCARRRDRT
jgi:hypothetical protein